MSATAIGSAPRVRRDGDGRPVFGLTVALSRRPRPDETSVRHLVEHGQCGFELSVADAATSFRTVDAVLADGDTELAKVSGAGADPVLALSTILDAPRTLAILDALDGKPGPLAIAVRGTYGTAGAKRSVRLRGKWLDVHRRLANMADTDGKLRHAQVYAVLTYLLGDGTVLVSIDGTDLPGGVPEDAKDAVAAAWLRAMSFLVKRETPELPATDPANRYSLKAAPSAGFPMDVTVTTTVPGSAELAWRTPLSDVLGGLLTGLGEDRYVRYVVLGEDEPEPAARATRRPVGPPPPPPAPQLPLAWDGLYPRDAARSNVRWYQPQFRLLPTSADSPRDGAGFLFAFAQRAGGGLTGKVTFRLSQSTAEEAAAACGAPLANMRSLLSGSPSMTLYIPYKDASTGQTSTQPFGARISAVGDIWTAEVDLLDDWVRLAYGALSSPGFQSRPAEFVVSYSYSSAYKGEAGFRAASTSRAVEAVDGHGPSIAMQDGGDPPPIWVDPSQRWNVTTEEVRQSSTTLFPCSTYKGRYRQQFADGERIIGCQDALRLGEVNLQQYAELTDLAADFGTHCKVFRSLQQPSQFLVVPARYRITRFPADDPNGRAFRPDVVVYAVLGTKPEDSRYHLTASLQPDLASDVRRDLEYRLISYAVPGVPPRLVFPTDATVNAAVGYRWADTGRPERPEVQPQAWDNLRVELASGAENTLLILEMIGKNGYSGTATFTLPDGMAVASQLLLDSYVAGPPATGPVPSTVTGTTATLTNRIERAVTVPELLTFTGAGVRGTVASGQSIAPGAALQVTVPAGVAKVWPRCVPAGGPLAVEELRVFVRDVQTDLVVVDLIDHAARGIKRLHVGARVHAADPVEVGGDFPDTREVRLRLTLPVTDYLRANSVGLRFTREMTDGTTVTGPWLPWDTARKGNVVSVDWDLLSKT
ncbi:hypothetical protein [Amycolatopsis sp. NPDC059657]|uniref:hypothetical protein n=1 Tax=Amycolatopsis sp. NPDC059657 TaxID=3346899 RepID=UPI00366EB33C